MSHPHSLAEAKQALRKEMLRWRRSLPLEEAQKKSERIGATVRTLPEYKSAKTILFYVSAKKNEVDTHALIREALSKGVKALVPVTDFDMNELIVSELLDMKELAPARFGLLEPGGDAIRPANPAEADIIIVPGVAFDRECRRIGFGGGYYDRLLSDGGAVSIALSYEGQMVERVPTDSRDLPADIIVTEIQVYRAPKTAA
jgi:5-formyltetrahydrofolate cyclo-ligase